MSSSQGSVWGFIQEYSVLLVVGAFGALIWANINYDSYHHLVDMVLIDHFFIGHLHDGHRTLTLHYLINDVLMALFFAIAGKEVWEAVALKSGSLRGKKAMTPLIATAGGIIGPAGVYLLGAYMVGKLAILSNGWAIPIATDIAFSYLVGRIIFGAKHPAVGFLLLLAIADDAAGLVILAIFYPQNALSPEWLLLSVGAALAVWYLFNYLPRQLDKGMPRGLCQQGGPLWLLALCGGRGFKLVRLPAGRYSPCPGLVAGDPGAAACRYAVWPVRCGSAS